MYVKDIKEILGVEGTVPLLGGVRVREKSDGDYALRVSRAFGRRFL